MNEKKRNTLVNIYMSSIVVVLAGVLITCTALFC